MTIKNNLTSIPTNIVTGFLGVGKTTAILNLLKAKPKEEKWAILVNEFGEIGLDGELIQHQSLEQTGITIKEVPGGCMCCAAGLPMQIALNQLLVMSQPDRLIIEPTGLGHPLEVMQVLSGQYYQDVLSLNKTITLVDGRQIDDSRYTNNDTFQQQLKIADIIIGNKMDLYSNNTKENLTRYIRKDLKLDADILFTEQGVINIALINGNTSLKVNKISSFDENVSNKNNKNSRVIPDSKYKCLSLSFDAYTIFDRDKLIAFFKRIEFERLKGIFITSSGIYGYNISVDCIDEIVMDDTMESKLEIISLKISEDWQSEILACVETANCQ